MDDLTLLAQSVHEVQRVIAGLGDDEMDTGTNCPPWTVRRLASHVLKNQLFWAGLVTGQELMAQEEAMAAVPYDGELAPIAAEVSAKVVDLWNTDGVLTAVHRTPFGELPGAVVVNFAIIDATAHAWDLSASVGRAIEFPEDWIPRLSGVVQLTCTEHTVELGLVKPPTRPPFDATGTQRLMAAAGREPQP
ncbi:MAG TPA: TIGR03086 family metal-binding protein [Nocardioides sp.]|nr:TIGR03086 family metal-binding protein [Nocardioides sp.]